MPQAPVEFSIAGHTFRHYPLAAIPLAREHHKLLVRADDESGMLNTLAFTFDGSDFEAITRFDAAGMAKLGKLLVMLVGIGKHSVALVPDDDDEAPEPKAVDTLPSTLADLLLYYAALGKIEQRVDSSGTAMWVDLQSEDQFNQHPLSISAHVCAFYVLRGLFAPLADLLPTLSDKVKGQASTESTSQSAETSAAAAPTSES